jgi:TIR domain
MKAFISYTREKNAYDHVVSSFHERLLNGLKLRKRSSQVFMDKSAIAAGMSSPAEIDKALADSDVLIVLLSPAWLESASRPMSFRPQ